MRGCVYGAHRILVDAGELPDEPLRPSVEHALEVCYAALPDRSVQPTGSPQLDELTAAEWRRRIRIIEQEDAS